MKTNIDPLKHSFPYCKKNKICVQDYKTGKEIVIARKVHRDYILLLTRGVMDFMVKNLSK